MTEDDPKGGTSPCMATEIRAGHAIDAATWRDVARFRRAERERLLALRRGMDQADRAEQTDRVITALEQALGDVAGKTIAAYWPIRGELDLRPLMSRLHEAGARIGLPVVVEQEAPVAFHRWEPRCRMTRGFWNIPVPVEQDELRPDVVICPLLGVDAEGFRLGNGGGYYDRTLASLDPRPEVIGVGQDFCPLPTIFPQPWDIAMDRVILGNERG